MKKQKIVRLAQNQSKSAVYIFLSVSLYVVQNHLVPELTSQNRWVLRNPTIHDNEVPITQVVGMPCMPTSFQTTLNLFVKKDLKKVAQCKNSWPQANWKGIPSFALDDFYSIQRYKFPEGAEKILNAVLCGMYLTLT